MAVDYFIREAIRRHRGGEAPRRPDSSYEGYGVLSTLDGSRVDREILRDPEWIGRDVELDLRAAPRVTLDHRGRGPRPRRRSDARIREDLCERLLHHPEIDASDVDVDVVGSGQVVLDGVVESLGIKRWIEDIAYAVPGVADVLNHLRVDRDRGGLIFR